MEAKAKAVGILGSAQKMRLVADVVRKKPVNEAIALLHQGLPKKASVDIERLVRSAVANLQQRSDASNIDIDDLFIKAIMVDIGSTLRRGRPRAQGRYYRRLRRSSHITVVVADS